MLQAAIFVLSGLALAYTALLVCYRFAWRNLPVFEIPADYVPHTAVSVVIPARNEAANIGPCLRAILGGTYPKELMEIVVVDDFSDDGTASIAEQYAAGAACPVRVFRLDAASGAGFGKKSAIEYAVAQARGTLIATTDADGVAPPGWLLYLAALQETRRPKAIAAPVMFQGDRNLLQHFQALDFAGLMGITAAGMGRHHMGNGANLAYPKAVFDAVQGYSGVRDRASGDDMFLLQKIARQWPGEIVFLKNAGATVQTEAMPGLRAFWQQRLRWGTKNAALPDWPVRIVLGLVFVFCLALVLEAPLAFFYPDLRWAVPGCLLLKAAADYLLLRDMCAFFGRRDLLRWFWPSVLLHTVYIAGIGAASLFFKTYTWKGRSLK